MAFNDRLKEARLNKKMTQEQVAEKIGVAKSTFTGYEKGNSEPNMNTISRIMNTLDVDANFLYQDEMDELGGSLMQLKYDEMKHIKKYRDLDDHGKEMVNFTLEKEWERSISQEKLEDLGADEYFQVKEKLDLMNSEILDNNTTIARLREEISTLTDATEKLTKQQCTQTNKLSRSKELYNSVDYAISNFFESDAQYSSRYTTKANKSIYNLRLLLSELNSRISYII